MVVNYDNIPHVYDVRVLSLQKFLPAGPVGEGEPHARGSERKKHMVKLWTDPGGTRVLTVGAIRLKDPGRVKAGLAAAATREGAVDGQVEASRRS